MIDMTPLRDMIRELVKKEIQKGAETPPFVRMGTIPSTYTSGRPQVIFDGEAAASGRTYPYLSSYTPAANDRVLLVKAGNTWVVIGKIN